MNWNRAFKVSGFLGATVCGVCLAKTCTKSSLFVRSVSAADDCQQCDGESDPGINVACLKLKQVHVYFRHGARTPLHLAPGLEEVAYPSDFFIQTPPHFTFKHNVVILPDMRLKQEVSQMEQHYLKTKLKGGTYAGNLTTYGQQQMYELGLRLRECYILQRCLLDPCFNPKEVFVQSTNIDRTIVSTRCVMAGMFGKENLERNGPVLIPVSLTEDEVLFPNPHACPLLKKVNHAAMVHYDNIPGIKDDRLKIEQALGLGPEPEKKIDFIGLRDDLIARTTHGYPYPEKLLPYRCMIESNAVKLLFYAMCGQTDAERLVVTRLSGGPALSLAFDSVDRTRSGERSVPKIHLYSCHDSTMMPLLEVFGLFDHKWPPFAADLRIELYEDADFNYYVRVLYCGEVKKIRGQTQAVIPWGEFNDKVSKYVIPRGKEYDTLCGSNIIKKLAAALLVHDKGEVETEEIKEKSEIPAGM